jgi:hypothetical protein
MLRSNISTVGMGLIALGIAASFASCAGKSVEDDTDVEAGKQGPLAPERADSADPAPLGLGGGSGYVAAAIDDPAPVGMGGGSGYPPAGPVSSGTGGGSGNPPAEGPDLPCAAEALAAFPGYTNVALYHFEETRGAQLRDSSGLVPSADPVLGVGLGGTVVGARRGEGHCGRGLSLAANAHAELSPVGTVFDAGVAVGVWVRPSSIGAAEAHLVGDGGLGLASFQLVLDAGHPVFLLSDRGGAMSELLRSSTPLVAGIWQYVSVSYEPGLGSLSVDGNEVATTDIIWPIAGSYNVIAVGGIINASPCCDYHHQFDGDIDEVAIFAR